MGNRRVSWRIECDVHGILCNSLLAWLVLPSMSCRKSASIERDFRHAGDSILGQFISCIATQGLSRVEGVYNWLHEELTDAETSALHLHALPGWDKTTPPNSIQNPNPTPHISDGFICLPPRERGIQQCVQADEGDTGLQTEYSQNSNETVERRVTKPKLCMVYSSSRWQ
jgi:hypothetical protein